MMAPSSYSRHPLPGIIVGVLGLHLGRLYNSYKSDTRLLQYSAGGAEKAAYLMGMAGRIY